MITKIKRTKYWLDKRTLLNRLIQMMKSRKPSNHMAYRQSLGNEETVRMKTRIPAAAEKQCGKEKTKT